MTMKMEKKAQIQKYQQEELTRYKNWLNNATTSKTVFKGSSEN